MQQENSNLFLRVYDRLFAHYGPQNWWPGETDLEVMVGAVLTQNTNWTNVEKAIANLKNGGQLSFPSLHKMSAEVLAEYIRPAGYYNIKARRLKNLFQMIVDEYEGELSFLFEDGLDESRANLLRVKGVGPETADAILLYAAKKPIFVIDTYTHRVFSRHGLVEEDTDYYSLQQEFLDSLPEEVSLFNEYHALIVAVAKEFCKKKKPRCSNCPLQRVEEN
ncbi:MAG TPA: endonuclease III domain-containing protein [Desulfocapsa sulfexigens]|nr:endonuclease III domain-containing protein [Desulfocapsa sulfexigens]